MTAVLEASLKYYIIIKSNAHQISFLFLMDGNECAAKKKIVTVESQTMSWMEYVCMYVAVKEAYEIY